MKILYFHQHFTTPKGSTGTRSYEMSRRLVERGHEVTIVCGAYSLGKTGLSGPMTKGRRTGVVDGVNIVELDLRMSNHDSFLKRTASFVRFAVRSVWYALSHDYDLVFATSTPLTAGIPGIVAKILRKKPFVFEVRDLWPELPREMGVIKNPLVLGALSFLEWLSYRNADACIGLSPGIVEGIKRRAPSGLPVAMIPNGCDVEIFKPGNRGDLDLHGIEPNDFVAVFTGAHGRANGLGAVLNSAAELQKRGRLDIKLVFIGDGKLKPDLVSRVNTEELGNCLFFDPVPKDQLNQILASVDAGMMILANVPAFYYGTSPNKFFDYIACGLPVINNYPGWLAEIIQEKGCGLVVPPQDAGAFADALVQLADKREDALKMGHQSRKLADGMFDRSKLAETFCSYLEQFGAGECKAGGVAIPASSKQ